MIAGSMVTGVAGAILTAGGAVVMGQPLLMVAGCYVAGGSLSMLATLAWGARARRRGPPPPRHPHPALCPLSAA